MEYMQLLLIVGIIFTVLILFFLFFWRFYFLRNPEPKIPVGEKMILSPAEGLLTRIIPFENGEAQNIEKGMLGKFTLLTNDVAKEGYLLLIRLHVYNIHFQRAPINGTIEKITYTQGKFFNAVKEPQNLRCLFENERNEIFIKGKIGKKTVACKVVQIAGFLARRIECFMKEQETVKKSDLLGLINLGSQVALIIPKITLEVQEGQNIKAGETIIGTFP